MSTIDLNNPPPNHRYTVTVQREETSAEQKVRLFKDVALFVAALGLVLIVTVLCVSVMLSDAASADEKKWAMSFLTGAAGGLVGYLVKR